jgi:hypothetical protein
MASVQFTRTLRESMFTQIRYDYSTFVWMGNPCCGGYNDRRRQWPHGGLSQGWKCVHRKLYTGMEKASPSVALFSMGMGMDASWAVGNV